MKTAPERFRLTPEMNQRLRLDRRIESTDLMGNNGMFIVPKGRDILRCMISDGEGWEHVSVSLSHRCPTWEEMCFVKDMFFEAEETVVQFHPPQSEYVNFHPFCLHLWRSTTAEPQRPPSILVGPRR